MRSFSMGYLYVAGTVLLTVYGQIAIKMQMSKAGALPDSIPDKAYFLVKQLLGFGVASGLCAAVLAAFCWMAALTKFDLTHAYLFIGLTFALVFAAGFMFLGEPFSYLKLLGICIILIGVAIGALG